MSNKTLTEKYNNLKKIIKTLGSLAVGFSGGVDSTFLLTAAHEALGGRALAVIARTASVPEREIDEAAAYCEDRGIGYTVITVDAMREDAFRNNAPDRCYFCKRLLFSEIIKTARENGIEYVAEGSNLDDEGDYRPGLRAVAELSVKCPLREAGFTKREIREMSRLMGLPTWSKPAYACLATRIPYGEEVTPEKLHMIEMAENYLIGMGFAEERVRVHGNLARIEVPPEDIGALAEEKNREAIFSRFRELGFMFVTLDMRGYRTGSMNETIGRT